jgi:hypothetical protein
MRTEVKHLLYGSTTLMVAGLLSGQATPMGANPEACFPIAGSPPLTMNMVRTATNFFQWLLDASLTAEQREQFRDSIAESWRARKPHEIQATVNVVQFADQLDVKTAQEREVYRQLLQAKFLAQMRSQPGSLLAGWILNIYDSAHKAIAPGNPPLTQQVVDAYAEVVNFMLRAAMGKAFYAADRSFKDALTKDLIARYPQLSNEEQAEMARIPLAWALLQAKWPTIPSTEQEKLRMLWRRSFEPILGRTGPPSSVPNGAKQSASRSASEPRRAKILGEFPEPELHDENHKYHSEPQSFLRISMTLPFQFCDK